MSYQTNPVGALKITPLGGHQEWPALQQIQWQQQKLQKQWRLWLHLIPPFFLLQRRRNHSLLLVLILHLLFTRTHNHCLSFSMVQILQQIWQQVSAVQTWQKLLGQWYQAQVTKSLTGPIYDHFQLRKKWHCRIRKTSRIHLRRGHGRGSATLWFCFSFIIQTFVIYVVEQYHPLEPHGEEIIGG